MALSAKEADAFAATWFNRIRGQLCGMIESWGLPERQEKGAISTTKTLTYDMQRELLEKWTREL